MLSLRISDTKQLMSLLLKEAVFDHFLVHSFTLITFATFHIDGLTEAGYDDPAETGEKYCTWGRVRPVALSLIRGRKQPKSMRLVLSMPRALLAEFPEARALFCNLTLEEAQVRCTGGCAQNGFSLDRSLEAQWDAWLLSWFQEQGIFYTQEG